MRSTAAVALCMLLAGCGQASVTTVATGRHSGPPVSRGASATANRHAAQREAARLLSLAAVPPGAVAVSAHPASLDGPALGMTGAASLVVRTHFWRVPSGLATTYAWLRAHPPRGLAPAGTSAGAGPSYRMQGLGYSEPDRAGIQDLELAIGAASLPGGGTAIRADGMAVWLDPLPLRDGRTGRRLHVTVGQGCPRTDAGAVGVRPAVDQAHGLGSRLLPAAAPTAALICDYSGMNTHPARHLLRARRLDIRGAQRLATAVGGLTLGHPVGEVMHCPFADGTGTVLAFSYDGRPDVDLWLDRNGCAYVSNGRIMTRAGTLAAAVTSAERAAA